MRIDRKRGIGLMLAGVAVIVLAGVLVLGNGKDGENGSAAATTTPSATSASTATTTIDDLFSQPPIIPEAKVSTEGWKTCRNEEYGWEVKYPGEWYVYGEGSMSTETPAYVRTTPCKGVGVLLSSIYHKNGKHETDQGTPPGSISVLRHTDRSQGIVRSEMRTIKELAELYAGNRKIEGLLVLNNGTIQALWTRWPQSNVGHFELFYNGVPYEITTGKGLTEEYRSTILSTFRFLDTPTSTTTATTPE